MRGTLRTRSARRSRGQARRQSTARKRPPRSKSIAVLPFENSGGDESLDYVSDGLTESIINSLSQLPDLRVVPRGSVFRYKGVKVDPGAAGLALNARTLLTGRVARRGDQLTVQAELVDSASESQLWGEQYRRPLSEMQGMQEEIAWHISEALRIRLTGEQKKRLTRKKTHSSDAYQEHLRGRYHWNRWTPEGFRAAVEHFERAVALDPTYAPAWAGIGDASGALAFYGLIDPSTAWPRPRPPRSEQFSWTIACPTPTRRSRWFTCSTHGTGPRPSVSFDAPSNSTPITRSHEPSWGCIWESFSAPMASTNRGGPWSSTRCPCSSI